MGLLETVAVRFRTLRARDKGKGGAAEFRSDARIYSLRGDNRWGNSVTWQTPPGEKNYDEQHGKIVGWLPQKPRGGDILAVKMASGKWGKWLIESVEHCGNPSDMFFAEVSGAYGYIEDEDVPATASARGGGDYL